MTALQQDATSDLVRAAPLVADLHVHLLGTGDTNFWADELRALKPTVSLPVESLPVSDIPTNPHQLADDPDLLRQLLVTESRSWPIKHVHFSKYLKLRQAIAWINPESLSRLITWNASRYASDGVFYVEFSVGAGWLGSSPHTQAIAHGVGEAARELGVEVRLLLAFNRRHASADIHNAKYLRALEPQLDQKLAPLREPQHFTTHIAQLQRAKDVCDRTNALPLIVGLDYMGDELYAPYPPFLLESFQSFASEMRRDHPRFGFRLHAGERSFPNDATGYVALRVAHYVIESLTRLNYPTRVGHAVGLATLSDRIWKRFLTRYGSIEARRAWESTIAFLNATTMEICLTSNECLIGIRPAEHVCADFIASPFSHAVLATDDPDVFQDGGTLRAEFEIADAAGLIGTQERLQSLIDESMYGSFAHDTSIERVAAKVAAYSPRPRVRGRPIAADPPEKVLAEIERLIRYDKPHKAIDRIWKVDSAYRRSPELMRLSEIAAQALRNLNAGEGYPRSYGDWIPPNLRKEA